MMDTLQDIYKTIYEGEAKAVLRLRAFSQIAETEGLPQIARLFMAIAASEEVHGTRAMKKLGLLGKTEENLKTSFESERDIAESAYDNFLKQAYEKGDKAAQTLFSQSRDVEATHAALYKKAMAHFMQERETTYYICEVCGFVSDGTLPDTCPVCGAKREKFETL